jgi:hypothetical protein
MRAAVIALLLFGSACSANSSSAGQTLTAPSGARPTPTWAATPSPSPAGTPSPEGTAGSASSGPGTPAAPSSAPLASVTRSAAPTGTTSVTDSDSGSTVTLHLGELLKVHLGNGTWDPPVSSAPGVVRRESTTGGYPSSAPAYAMFKALARGSADVTATSDAACFHTDPRCLMPSRQWTVHVVVM